MDAGRFDTLSRSLSSRLSRRTVLRVSGPGLAAGAAAGPLWAAAQDATPNPLSDDPTFLFVQTAAGGTFATNPGAGTASVDGTPVAGGGADYLLTLTGHTGNTIYFSDRPERIFGEAPTQTFLVGLGVQPDNPPNAALVTNDADGNEDILVVELLSPSYDAGAGSVTYGANILSDYEGGLNFVASRQRDEDLPPSFGEASLFIDDCPDITNCYNDKLQPVGLVPGGPIGLCWVWSEVSCQPCDGQSIQSLNDLCTQTYPDSCNGDCIVLTA